MQVSLDRQQLEALFSVIICLDARGIVRYASATAKRHVKELRESASFFELFTILRPNGVSRVEDMKDRGGSLFLMKSRSRSFAARGQVVELQWGEDSLIGFCGSPWLFWLNTNCPETKLGIGDFSPQDAQLDQLFLMTTEQRMVSDLEKLNAELSSAKEELEEAQATKNAMFARMSHEMRTPLNGVISALALLSDQVLPEDARRLLKLAQSSSRNLLHVINYVLDISKFEGGGAQLEPLLFDLDNLLKSVTEIVRARAVEKQLDLRWRSSPQLTGHYVADKAKLRQCLLNIVTNAIKFTPSGSVELRAVPSASTEGSKVRFEVEDSGVGISAVDQQRIFEPFWTGPNDAFVVDKGTGLGLDIVRRNVEFMGGEVGVVSTPGRGTIFWLEVPMESSDESPAETEAGAYTGAAIPRRFRGKVLLVDDNRTNLLLGRMILESLGLTVVEARDGASAISQAHGQRFDLVLMDISMPGIDGVQATVEIRRFANREELPIIALTAFASSDERERCSRAGMNDYVTKPVVRDRLAEKLLEYLQPEDPEPGADRDTVAQPGKSEEQASDTPLFSRAILDDLRGQIGENNLDTVLDQFESEVETRWSRLQQAVGSADKAAIIREAHTLGSTCRSLGLLAASHCLYGLESALRADSVPPAGILSQIDDLLAPGMSALADYRATR